LRGVDVITAQEDGSRELEDADSNEWINRVEYLPLK